ncbi:MAG TPA: HAD family hydrolase [Candidatus Saccharimonadales bacterium]|nr:HAD family hydrolase [Candidatus Saccharimonadales bacterium]
MTAPGLPAGICFDYGSTLVDFTRPVAAIAAAGESLAAKLPLAGSAWKGTAGEFALALDLLLDRLIDDAHRELSVREVDIESIHREATQQLLGCVLNPELSAELEAALQRAWVAGASPVRPALTVVNQLKERGLRIGLCSNAPYPPALMYEQLDQLDLRRYFDAVLFSSEIGWRKPDPRIFAELLMRMGLPASSVWFVGDEWGADIEGARGVGMAAILAPAAAAPFAAAAQLSQWGDLVKLLG